ncbi:chemotaxis protein CheB, partial [Mesorhizobium sp.]
MAQSARKASTGKARANSRESAKEFAPFPIIGIGASAGGIGALQKFFPEVPVDSGFAYVVIQHLDAEHESVLASIIQRSTAIETKTAAEGLKIEPDHIYVTPPGVSVTVEGQRFHVAKMTTMRARRTPIDDFFASLAHDQAE